MLRDLLDWWDGVELWLTQLAFPFQVLLAVLVLLPGCWLAAALVDRGVDRALAAVAARRPEASQPAPDAATGPREDRAAPPAVPETVSDTVPDTVPDAVRDSVPDRCRSDSGA